MADRLGNKVTFSESTKGRPPFGQQVRTVPSRVLQTGPLNSRNGPPRRIEPLAGGLWLGLGQEQDRSLLLSDSDCCSVRAKSIFLFPQAHDDAYYVLSLSLMIFDHAYDFPLPNVTRKTKANYL